MSQQIPLLLAGWPRQGQRGWIGILTVLVFALPSTTLGQENTSRASFAGGNDPFAVYEADLSGAATRTLDRAVRPQSGVSMRQTLEKPGTAAELTALPSHYTRIGFERVALLRPMLDPILRQVGVPTELAAIVVVESGGDSTALSPKGARGLWQLMPDTARRYGLTVNADTDERLDVLKSTRAAAEYLRDLYSEFHDWQLALAAYNAGEQAVQQALARTGGAGFLVAAPVLPAETRNYVPAVLAVLAQLDGHMQKRLMGNARLLPAVYATMGR